MTKTVKEILREAHGVKYQGDSASELLRKLSIDILQAHENELAKKDKEIEKLKYTNAIYSDELYSRDETQLFKEDFEYTKIVNSFDIQTGLTDFINGYVLKDNSKYDKLDSKDVK